MSGFEASSGKAKAKIVQFADDTRTLPDGGKITYAETEDRILIHHKIPFEKGVSYIYERKTGRILVNGAEGSNVDKRRMIELGGYFLNHSQDDDLVTINVFGKGQS
jgi:hypothetical protein